jgi:hypothetical protein
MREVHGLVADVDRQLEDAVRAKQQLAAERWRDRVRPAAMRVFAAETATLHCSRALLKLLIEELYPDDLFTELVGDLNGLPMRRWPQAVAIAVALRHSWRLDDLARIAKQLRVSLPLHALNAAPNSAQDQPSRERWFGSPRSRQGFPLRSNPVRGSRP